MLVIRYDYTDFSCSNMITSLFSSSDRNKMEWKPFQHISHHRARWIDAEPSNINRLRLCKDNVATLFIMFDKPRLVETPVLLPSLHGENK